jgi:hypothetical protein
MKLCLNCQTRNDLDAQFCTNCGAEVGSPATPEVRDAGTAAGVFTGIGITFAYFIVQLLAASIGVRGGICVSGYLQIAITIAVIVWLVVSLVRASARRRFGEKFIVAAVISTLVCLVLPALVCTTIAISEAAQCHR